MGKPQEQPPPTADKPPAGEFTKDRREKFRQIKDYLDSQKDKPGSLGFAEFHNIIIKQILWHEQTCDLLDLREAKNKRLERGIKEIWSPFK